MKFRKTPSSILTRLADVQSYQRDLRALRTAGHDTISAEEAIAFFVPLLEEFFQPQ